MESPAKKIRFLLHTHSTTIQTLADALGVTRDNLREIVDEQAQPTTHLLQTICAHFHLREDYFGLSRAVELKQPEPAAKPQAARPSQRPSVRPGAGPAATQKPAAGVKPKKRKVDVIELFLRHQALVDCLIARNLFTRPDYEKRLEILREKLLARRQQET